VDVVVAQPAVSVIIPTYREEETIAGCLKNVQKQDFGFGGIETIVVDSHSPDKTRELAAPYADKVVDVHARGVGKARNAGAKIAQGELLLFVDADTFLDKRFVSEVWRSFSDPKVVCVSGILQSLEALKPSDSLFATLHYGFLNMWAAFSARMGFAMFPSVCVAARKSVFLQMGGFVEDMAVGEDMTFSRTMNKLGKCLVNPKAVCYTSVRRITKCGKIEMYSMYFKNYVRIYVLKQKPWVQDFPHVTTS